MEKIKISEVRVDERQRTKASGLADLANSLRKYGQLQPIILDGDNRLIAGFRRLSAAVLAGWEEIGYVRSDATDGVLKQELELIENIHREELPWQDRALALRKIHDMKVAQDPEWSTEKTGEMVVGMSGRTVRYAVDLADNLHRPEIAQASTMTGAIGRLQSIRATEDKIQQAAALADKVGDRRYEIHIGRAEEILPQLPDESVDAIITNPPFGIDLDFKGTKPYEDDEEQVMAMMEAVVPHFYRVLRPGSWLCCFFDIVKLFPWKPQSVEQSDEFVVCRPGLIWLLQQAGFTVNVLPCIWAKPNKTQGKLRDPNTDLIMAYEAFVLARKGDAVLQRKGRQNLFIYDTLTADERMFDVEMPIPLCEDLVTLLTVGNQVVLDAFAGSMSIPAGALGQQRMAVAIELNAERAARGETKLYGEAYGQDSRS